ncbi:MAG: phosphomannomutase [Natronomonas sp.]|jgi:phosphomannomutase
MDEDDPSNAIEFGTDGWRAVGDEFTMERVRAIGAAVADLLDADGADGPLAIGYDARDHSREAAEQLGAVVAASGRAVTISDTDCPTPVLAWTVRTGSYVGGFMVTASHNPPEYNGVKYIVGDGTPALPAITDEIERRLAEPGSRPQNPTGASTEDDFTAAYAEHARSFVDADLDGLEIGYDAMHGSGRGVTDQMLDDADADLTRLRCRRDPTFGGGSPEPVPENAAELIALVDGGSVSLGLINDGDADRLGVVTPDRGFVDPNVLLAVLYEYLLGHSPTSGDVVRTVSTSSLVDQVARQASQEVHETAVGFKWVAESMVEHDALAGGEESGGYGIGSHLPNKDGVLLALLLAAAHAERSLDERIDALFEEHGDIVQDRRSLDCPDERKAAVIDELGGMVPDRIAGREVAEIQTVDGFKICLEDDSWILIRPSGTEPKLRVYAEADSQGRVSELLDAGDGIVRPLLG